MNTLAAIIPYETKLALITEQNFIPFGCPDFRFFFRKIFFRSLRCFCLKTGISRGFLHLRPCFWSILRTVRLLKLFSHAVLEMVFKWTKFMGSCNKSFISQSCFGRSSVSCIIGHIPGHKILVPKISDNTLLASKKFRNHSKINSNF